VLVELSQRQVPDHVPKASLGASGWSEILSVFQICFGQKLSALTPTTAMHVDVVTFLGHCCDYLLYVWAAGESLWPFWSQ
jgi:hypothetical protein